MINHIIRKSERIFFFEFFMQSGLRRSQSRIIVLYPTEAIEAARLKEIKLFPSCGCDDVIRITFTVLI